MSLPIAGRWFERRSAGDGLTLLWEPHVHPLLRCNIWHLRGRDADLLVDSGMGLSSLKAAARDLFGVHVLAVATHAHIDHVGGHHEFEHRLVHAAEAERLARGRDAYSLDREAYDPVTRDRLAAVGYDISSGLLSAIPHAGFSPADHVLRGAEPTRILTEGDMVDLGDRAFEVLHLPGHSPGSIGLWESATGTLFSGDAIYDGPLLDDLPDSDIDHYRATMERLLTLPVTCVHAGHDPSFGADRLKVLARAYLDRTG
jgi:glyoxylase-like metal-dependent hydrolase (beta-lactamase superfamily II)